MNNVESNSVHGRLWEIDFFRGVALILMIIFHLVFDLKEFGQVEINYSSGFFYYLGKVAGNLFILLAAISCTLSKNNLHRGLKILGFGLVITLVSHIYNPSYGIKFGILHFLGVSILIYPLFKGLHRYNLLILGTLIIGLGYYVRSIYMPFDYLFPLGLTGNLFVSADYYPIFPYFGVFLYGIALSKILYPTRRSLFRIDFSHNSINYLGRHTLVIYLIHQPILMFLVIIFFG